MGYMSISDNEALIADLKAIVCAGVIASDNEILKEQQEQAPGWQLRVESCKGARAAYQAINTILNNWNGK